MSLYQPTPASHSRYWKTLRHAEQSKQPLDLVTQMYGVDGTWGFMTLSSNSKSGHWSVVVKANSGALSTGLRNAIDTDAVDTDRSQAGTLPPLLAGTSAGSRKKGPHWWQTCCEFPVVATLLRLKGIIYVFFKWRHTGPQQCLFLVTWALKWHKENDSSA